MLVDLLPNEISENAKGVNDLSVFRKDLLAFFIFLVTELQLGIKPHWRFLG
jgi:hypothetical protein